MQEGSVNVNIQTHRQIYTSDNLQVITITYEHRKILYYAWKNVYKFSVEWRNMNYSIMSSRGYALSYRSYSIFFFNKWSNKLNENIFFLNWFIYIALIYHYYLNHLLSLKPIKTLQKLCPLVALRVSPSSLRGLLL